MTNNNNKYTALDAFKIFLWTLVTTQAISFVVAIVLGVVAQKRNITFKELTALKQVGVLLSLVFPAVMSMMIFLFNKKRKIKIGQATYLKQKLKANKVLIVFLMSVVCLFLIAPFINLLHELYTLIGYKPDDSLPLVLTTPLDLVIGILVMAILPALVEELLFRGVILRGLNDKFNTHISVILSATFFALLHGALQQTAFQFILGLILGYVAIYGGLIYAIIMHFLNNLMVVLINFFSPQNSTQSFTFQGVIMALLFFLIAVYVLTMLINYLKNSNTPDKNIKNEIAIKNDKHGFRHFNKNLSLYEKQYFWLSISFAVIIWLANTLSAF